MKWFPNHGADKTRPTLDKVIAALKESGVTAIGATGYCFGGTFASPSIDPMYTYASQADMFSISPSTMSSRQPSYPTLHSSKPPPISR